MIAEKIALWATPSKPVFAERKHRLHQWVMDGLLVVSWAFTRKLAAILAAVTNDTPKE